MVAGTDPTDHLSCALSLALHPHLLLHVTNLRIQMKDLDVVAFGVFGGEGPPGTYIDDFANDLNGLGFPLLVDGECNRKNFSNLTLFQGFSKE